MNDFVDEATASCKRLLGQKVHKASPHRPDSQSVRLHVDNGTIIATRRKSLQRAELEVNVLKELHENGAPVPQVFAFDGTWLMQEDVGQERLSTKTYETWEAEGEHWLELALRSLAQVHSAATLMGLQERTCKIGPKPNWLREFIDTPRRIGRFLEVPCPKLDDQRLMYTLNVPGRSFVKWNARPTNAAARDDWTVAWYNWQHCCCRNRLDDVAWLIADELIPDWPVAEKRLLEQHIEHFNEGHYPGGPYTYLRVFGSMHMSVRLSILIREMMRHGKWNYSPDYGLAGGAPRTISNILGRGQRWAEAALVTRPLADWFGAVSEAFTIHKG